MKLQSHIYSLMSQNIPPDKRHVVSHRVFLPLSKPVSSLAYLCYVSNF